MGDNKYVVNKAEVQPIRDFLNTTIKSAELTIHLANGKAVTIPYIVGVNKSGNFTALKPDSNPYILTSSGQQLVHQETDYIFPDMPAVQGKATETKPMTQGNTIVLSDKQFAELLKRANVK